MGHAKTHLVHSGNIQRCRWVWMHKKPSTVGCALKLPYTTHVNSLPANRPHFPRYYGCNKHSLMSLGLTCERLTDQWVQTAVGTLEHRLVRHFRHYTCDLQTLKTTKQNFADKILTYRCQISWENGINLSNLHSTSTRWCKRYKVSNSALLMFIQRLSRGLKDI